MGKSKIEWTDNTWNPVTGCTKVSPGCVNCYAERLFPRIYGKDVVKMTEGSTVVDARPRRFTDVKIHLDRLDQPHCWRKPRMVFVCSMGDLFHEAVPDKFIDRVFAVMALVHRHRFQILTKRPKRMLGYLAALGKSFPRLQAACPEGWSLRWSEIPLVGWPLPNVWLGVSCEDQKRADERIPILLQTLAAVRFLSLEPLLGPICIEDAAGTDWWESGNQPFWVICGGESGPHARPMDPDWARSIRDQCKAAGVPFFMKQMARKAPIPKDLMVREFPA